MKPFTSCTSPVAVIDRDNVDTDMIVRIERMTTLKRGQFGPWAFEMLRYRADGSENGDFVLNREPFRHARILLARANFGCGSSREMAVWALDDFGIRCVIAESFGDIFYNNCLQNGVLPIRLPADRIAELAVPANTGQAMTVDLEQCTITVPGLLTLSFEFAEHPRQALLQGLDDIDQSLLLRDDIEAFRQRDRARRPWVYATATR